VVLRFNDILKKNWKVRWHTILKKSNAFTKITKLHLKLFRISYSAVSEKYLRDSLCDMIFGRIKSQLAKKSASYSINSLAPTLVLELLQRVPA